MTGTSFLRSTELLLIVSLCASPSAQQTDTTAQTPVQNQPAARADTARTDTARADTTRTSAAHSATAAPVVNLDTMVVTTSRVAAANALNEQIVPSLGATKRTLTSDQIELQAQGDNASFDQTLYRFPGVVQDELDKRLHVRGEEANLQYRINDVLLPDGLCGFGQELSPRFIDQLSLIVGTLPAQYGGRTAGIVDIRTKSGADLNGGDVSFYGGSYNTLNPSFECGAALGKWTLYATGGFMYDDIGMANPTSSVRPLHDTTYQFRGLASLCWYIDSTSRVSFILSGNHSDFQLPNTPGQTVAYGYDTLTSFNSSKLNENQNEQSYYEILAYQKKAGRLNFQLAQTARYSDVLYQPDTIGDLMFNGVASRADHSLVAAGLAADASCELGTHHTLRFGASGTIEQAQVNTSNWVFPATWSDSLSSWVQTGTTPMNIADDNSKVAYLYSCYVQDEWKMFKKLTVNYGLRFDGLNAYLDEYQLSPRINAVWQPFKWTTIHGGYGYYFTPPPIEFVPSTSITKFDSTTYGANPNNTQSSPVRSERYHYFDLGMTQGIVPGLQIGLDGYYKLKRYTLDEGQFGPAMIFSPNNSDSGYVRGVELTLNFTKGGFEAYGNVAFSQAMAYGITSGQFQFESDELAYLQDHWYHLDHDQGVTAALGASYSWKWIKGYVDALYGRGLYGGFCNTQELDPYVTVNAGVECTLKISKRGKLKARFDVTNLFDEVYEIRDGDGIGVFAPQYLPRRGFYGGLSWEF